MFYFLTNIPIKDWPIDTFGFGVVSSQMSDVRIRLNEECISSNRRGSLYLSRKCDRWDVQSLRDGYLVLKNTDTDQYLTSNSYGDVYITSYNGQDEQAWFIATNLKSTRLFNKLTREYLDRDQGGKIVTSPFYGRFQRTDKIIVVNNAKTVLNIDNQ